jgi:short-subunit dehydrogenase
MITGPTAGIGRAFANALAREGYDLTLVSRDAARLEQLAADLTSRYRVECQALPADLSDLDATRRVERHLRKRPVDVLVNNAGFGQPKSFGHNDVEAEQRGLDVLVRAVMRLTHAAVVTMAARGGGDIINVSSVAGFFPSGSYGAHKAWVTSFSTWAHWRYRSAGVRVIAVCPGFVRTEFHARISADMQRVPRWLWLTPGDVVADAMADLRAGKSISISSRRYRTLVAASRLVPREVVGRLASRRR